jgi:hypothetical protein
LLSSQWGLAGQGDHVICTCAAQFSTHCSMTFLSASRQHFGWVQ